MCIEYQGVGYGMDVISMGYIFSTRAEVDVVAFLVRSINLRVSLKIIHYNKWLTSSKKLVSCLALILL
jgi:hypothetical protein